MAMVFKSKKEITELTKKDLEHPGPGDYIPKTVYRRRFFKNKITPKINEINFHTNNNNPGPGYYFQNENKTIRDKKNEIISNKITTLKKTYEDELEEKNNNTFEKLGFNIKSKRFNMTKDEPPGPGKYFLDINKFYQTNFVNKIKEKYKLRRLNRNKPKLDLIPSIPSKDQQYGFNILKNGDLEHKKPPNFSQTFTGEKGDTVGPSYYDISKYKELYKTSPKWSISNKLNNKDSKSLSSTNFSDNSKYLDNTSNLLSSITANKFYLDENKNVKEISKHNISCNSLGSFSNSYYLNRLKINEGNKDIIKKYKNIDTNFKRIPFFRNEEKEAHKKEMTKLFFKINDNPGPGAYFNGFKNSSFNFKQIPESLQFFGSSAKRFNYPIKEKTSNKENMHEEYKTKKYKEALIPFLTSDERFKISKDKALFPSPNDYSPKKIKKSKSFSNFMNFGSSVARFSEIAELKKKNAFPTPGPGLYNPEKIKSHINTKKIMLTKDYNNKVCIFKNDLNYDLNTIAYKNYKKSNLTNLKTNSPLKKSHTNESIKSSPGFYYINKEYKIQQIIPPFHSSANRTLTFHSFLKNRVGPGQYKKDSYFDWNKKSFNINYV